MSVVIDNEKYTVYNGTGNRLIAYIKQTHKMVSYPRLLMEEKLGRPLEKEEDVHHIDGNPQNNNLDNLEVIKHGEHQKQHSTKYYWEDKKVICTICGKTFIWTAKQQKDRNHNRWHKDIQGAYFCSKRCIGINNQREQMKQKNKEK